MDDDITKPNRAERRRFERFNARLPVGLAERAGNDRSWAGSSQDVSRGGLCVETTQEFKLGEAINISMRIGTTELQLLGIVVWRRNGRIGIQFGELPGSTAEALENVLKDLGATNRN